MKYLVCLNIERVFLARVNLQVNFWWRRIFSVVDFGVPH